jgi:hypothetical protein
VEIDVLRRRGKAIPAIEREARLRATRSARSCAVSTTGSTAPVSLGPQRTTTTKAICKTDCRASPCVPDRENRENPDMLPSGPC